MSTTDGGAGAGDLWLLKFTWPGISGTAAAVSPDVPAARAGLEVWHSIDGMLGYAYLPVLSPKPGPAWLRLVRTLAPPAASAGEVAPYHYVVETDVEPGKEDDFNAWYDQEHLPGLAAVPGTVRAARYVDADATASPRSYACYDLLSPATLESAPWLAVRGTPWSARVRPTFRNTRRTMFVRADAASLSAF
jgi:hypothetical protein